MRAKSSTITARLSGPLRKFSICRFCPRLPPKITWPTCSKLDFSRKDPRAQTGRRAADCVTHLAQYVLQGTLPPAPGENSLTGDHTSPSLLCPNFLHTH